MLPTRYHSTNALHKLGIVLMLTATSCWSPIVSMAQEITPEHVSEAASRTTSKEQTEEQTEEQIDQWIIQLNGDRFDTRQNAQQQLTQARPVPLEKVSAAAQSGPLESTTRALNILINWLESKDEALRLAALQNLAQMTHRPREATMATRLLANHRERTALEAIIKFGAIVNDPRIGGLANRQIIIDMRWTGGDEGLIHLKDVRRVVTLSLYSAPVTDAGLEHLTQLPEIGRIELFGIKASKTGIQKLIDQLPPETVDARRSGALLGVKGDLQNQGKVTYVVPKSAAAKAGILPGDRITEINGDRVENFKALTQRIADYQPGDTVTLTIVRNNKAQKIKATFDQWGADTKIQRATQRLNILRNPRAIPQNQTLPLRIQVEPR